MDKCTRKTQWIAVAMVLLIPAGASADMVTPTAVPYSSGAPLDPESTYGAQVAIDGNLSTFCVIFDDTDNGSTPTTGHMVFDLGKVLSVDGANLISRYYYKDYNPKNVDFFYFADDNPDNNALVDDIENDSDIVLITSHSYLSLVNGAAESVAFPSTLDRRYIGMRINSSWEEGAEYWDYQIAEIQFSVIPEPTSLLLLLCGAASIFVTRSFHRFTI